MITSAELRSQVDAVWTSTLDDLAELVAIPSISSLPERADQVLRSAELIAQWCRELGARVEVVAAGGAPAVIAHFDGPEQSPTICLYAHHDVQPAGDPAAWTTPPFQAVEREGRLYGRGCADDKGGVAVHLAALRACQGRPPVNVTLFIEGEEEVGSPSLSGLLSRYHQELASDVFVIADANNWAVHQPAVTTMLRGVADCVVEVSTLSHGVHSGSFGGVVPDALTALCRLLATLHDERGDVAVAGLASHPAPELDYPLDRLAAETGLLEGVQFIGTGSVVERLWTRPAIAVIGVDAVPIAEASNTIIPTARAKVSLRVPPGEDADQALAALTEHLLGNAPWGARVSVQPGQTGQPGLVDFSGPVSELAGAAIREGFGVEPVQIGCGGSIPMIAEFQQAFPAAAVLVTAVTDPDSRIHGIDESVDLGDLRSAARSELLLLHGLARPTAAPAGH